MAKITLSNVGSLIDATTAANTINTNSDRIEEAIEDTLSRDGTGPNQMEASLDMNSNHILNLPAPASSLEPVRVIDINNLIEELPVITGHLPIGGTSGQLLAKNSAIDYDASWVSPTREKLTGSRNYYVRTDGNNSNTGLVDSPGGAFLTIQRAIDVISRTLDLNGQDVIVNVADGTYTGGVSVDGPFLGAGTVTVSGNVITPSNCLIHTTSSNCFSAVNNSILIVYGFKLQTTTAGHCVNADMQGRVLLSSLDFSTCAESHITIANGGIVQPFGGYTISGDPGLAHIHMPSGGGEFIPNNITITLVGSRSWGAYFIGMRGPCYANFTPIVFAGPAAVGGKGVIHIGAVLDSENLLTQVIPGSLPLSISKGGNVITPSLTLNPGDSSYANLSNGLLWVDNGFGDTALISYASNVATPVIVWSTSANYVLVDPGAGTNKIWVQPGGLFTNRFVGALGLRVAFLTPTFSSL